MNEPTKPKSDLPPDLQAEADALLAETSVPSDQDIAPGQPAPADNDMPTGDLVGELLNLTVNGVVAPMRGSHWNMTEQECRSLGNAYGAVLDKYFPNLSMGAEVTALVVTVTVVGPRIAKDMEIAAMQNNGATAGGEPSEPTAEDAANG